MKKQGRITSFVENEIKTVLFHRGIDPSCGIPGS
jgi:hypothetical protein